MFKKATLSLAAAITLLAPVAATAQTEEATSVTVNVDDLDLSSPKDQARMNNRIKTAARMICGDPGDRSFAAIKAQKECVNQAVSNSGAQAKLAISKAVPRHAINTQSVRAPLG